MGTKTNNYKAMIFTHDFCKKTPKISRFKQMIQANGFKPLRK